MRAEFVLDYDVVTLEQPQKLYLMARFESGPATVDRVRRPLNLSLVIDRSGSMAGAKIDYTRQAAQFLVQHLGAKDTLSIVLYNDRVDTLLMPETIQAKDIINQRIAGIKVGGTTNLSSGWLEGCKLVTQNLNDERINRVILMSDGLANRGVTSTEQLVAMAQQKQDEGVSTTTMGMGDNFNEDLLTEMAHAGGGAYYFIESPESAPIIFQEELQGLLNVVGQNLTISLEPTDRVAGVRQLNAYPMHMDGKAYAFRLGDVFGDELKALLLELAVPALKDLGEITIATLRFEYDELLDEGSKHHSVEFPVLINVAPKGEQPALAHPEVEESVLLLKAAQARRDAVESADHGQFDTAATTLRDMADQIKKSRVESDELQDEHSALIQEAEDMDSARYTAHSRKHMHTTAFYTMTSRHGETAALRSRERLHHTQSMKAVSHEEDGTVERREGETPSHVTWRDQTFSLDKDLMRVGRASQNEIVIVEKGVSRFHCQITRQGDKLILEDLGSTNGTMMRGEVLTEPVTLSVGDVAYLCDAKLVFHDGSL
jgi:Ca-activated chloride channel family protein